METIRIYGVTLAKPFYRTKPYGHGCNEKFQYVDYLVDDLIYSITAAGLSNVIFKKLKKLEEENK